MVRARTLKELAIPPGRKKQNKEQGSKIFFHHVNEKNSSARNGKIFS